MEYIKVHWEHNLKSEPTDLFSEIDETRMEVRKIELYRNGSIGMASSEFEIGSTHLGEVPIPSIEEIALDPQFIPFQINKEEFEAVWNESIYKIRN